MLLVKAPLFFPRPHHPPLSGFIRKWRFPFSCFGMTMKPFVSAVPQRFDAYEKTTIPRPAPSAFWSAAFFSKFREVFVGEDVTHCLSCRCRLVSVFVGRSRARTYPDLCYPPLFPANMGYAVRSPLHGHVVHVRYLPRRHHPILLFRAYLPLGLSMAVFLFVADRRSRGWSPP